MLSFILFGSSVNDYFVYEFYKKSSLEKKKFVTFRKAKRIYRYLLRPEERKGYEDKFLINTIYGEFLGRDWLYINKSNFDEFQTFCEKHASFFVKPRIGALGMGSHIIDVRDKDIKELYIGLQEKDVIIEELIVQHPKMASLHPNSVNTVRVTSVLSDKVKFISTVLRMGNNLQVVDNHFAGGIVASIDIKTGIVYTTGIDKSSNRFIIHPVTGVQIVGFMIPFWEEIMSLVNRAAWLLPEVKHNGWDVAITKKGPILIECNRQGDMKVQQQSDQVGKFSLYQKAIGRDFR